MDKPICKLTGINGNVFVIISTVSRCLKREGRRDLAEEFTSAAFQAESYDDVLRLAFNYVEVE